MPDPVSPDPATEAAELVLGLLEGEARAAALRRMLADADFARQVAWWREQFSGLLDDYPAVAPPDDLLERIDTGSGAVVADAPTSVTGVRRPWRWFAGGAAGGAIAASLIAAVVIHNAPPTVVRVPVTVASRPAPALIAVLVPSTAGEQAPVAAWVTGDGASLRLTAAVPVPQGRSAELWSIGADKVPHPVGLLSPTGRSTRWIDRARTPRDGDTLAISIEPRGGSPTGAPTGPVIASGTLVMT